MWCFFINANHSEFNQTVGNNLGRAVKKVNILIIINYAEMQVTDTIHKWNLTKQPRKQCLCDELVILVFGVS